MTIQNTTMAPYVATSRKGEAVIGLRIFKDRMLLLSIPKGFNGWCVRKLLYMFFGRLIADNKFMRAQFKTTLVDTYGNFIGQITAKRKLKSDEKNDILTSDIINETKNLAEDLKTKPRDSILNGYNDFFGTSSNDNNDDTTYHQISMDLYNQFIVQDCPNYDNHYPKSTGIIAAALRNNQFEPKLANTSYVQKFFKAIFEQKFKLDIDEPINYCIKNKDTDEPLLDDNADFKIAYFEKLFYDNVDIFLIALRMSISNIVMSPEDRSGFLQLFLHPKIMYLKHAERQSLAMYITTNFIELKKSMEVNVLKYDTNVWKTFLGQFKRSDTTRPSDIVLNMLSAMKTDQTTVM